MMTMPDFFGKSYLFSQWRSGAGFICALFLSHFSLFTIPH